MSEKTCTERFPRTTVQLAAEKRQRGLAPIDSRPTLHLTNWASRRLHGPGRRYTIQARPRRWEHGDGYVGVLARHLGRTEQAIKGRARQRRLPSGRQGYHSLIAVSDRLGYEPETIQAFAEGNDIRLRKLPRTLVGRRSTRVDCAITEEQVEELIAAFTAIGWPEQPNLVLASPTMWGTGPKPASCLRCGETTRPHASRGLCTRCRTSLRRAGDLARYPRLTDRGEEEEES